MTKKANRKKVDVSKIITSDECQMAFASYNQADAEETSICAELDKQINALREAQAPRLAELAKVKDAQFIVMQTYAATNKAAFGDKKSIEFQFGKIGFRTATPSLKPTKNPETGKDFTWTLITQLIKKHRILKTYLKVTESVQKDKLLADRNLKNYTKHFAKVGIMVDQPENFYIEPKKEEVLEGAA